ncbi:MAG: SH3 domain-containing protein, partial [Clostridia bacterium]|nr:SH3 domain-containing protein [Clostridia bacterium]
LEPIPVYSPVSEPLSTVVPIPTPVPESTPIPDPVAEVTSAVYIIRVDPKNAAGIRVAPDKTSRKIGVAPAGKKYSVLSIETNGWYAIEMDDGQIGYISPNMAKIVK